MFEVSFVVYIFLNVAVNFNSNSLISVLISKFRLKFIDIDLQSSVIFLKIFFKIK